MRAGASSAAGSAFAHSSTAPGITAQRGDGRDQRERAVVRASRHNRVIGSGPRAVERRGAPRSAGGASDRAAPRALHAHVPGELGEVDLDEPRGGPGRAGGEVGPGERVAAQPGLPAAATSRASTATAAAASAIASGTSAAADDAARSAAAAPGVVRRGTAQRGEHGRERGQVRLGERESRALAARRPARRVRRAPPNRAAISVSAAPSAQAAPPAAPPPGAGVRSATAARKSSSVIPIPLFAALCQRAT